ncbi:uncharacterized protein LOC111282026 isoform X5 [Durio zibethinus]|uniref:Uncharacterized protein LOC111282026 isoform X5 n=1 Tax=Durio zibethinus TaxID=66656 RepID=A0A6P5XB91_DURZI|nr:uncharacterized protein LOC111282026 isoform X5 [Durio zibethinus]
MSTLHCHFQIQIQIQSDICSALQIASSTFRCLRSRTFNLPRRLLLPPLHSHSTTSFVSLPRAFSNDASVPDKPSICTADELHYVSLPNSDWRLALWRYHPPPQAPRRNHPLLLLSGVGTNAIGYDLSPGSSFARYMSGQGFDTWILEVRGAGLSVQASNFKEFKETADAVSEQMETMVKSVIKGVSSQQQPTNVSGSLSDSEISFLREDSIGIGTAWDESKVVTKLTEIFMRLSERLSGFLSDSQLRLISAKLFDQISKLLEDSQLSERFEEVRAKLSNLLEKQQNSGIASQIRDLSQRLVNIIEEGQRSVSPQFIDIQERLSSTIEDFQKQLDLIVKYDWDFDHYLEEDVPAAMEYVMAQTKPKDGKLLAIGHSMGGILLYAMLSRCGTIPAKLILQLATAFRAQGLCDRSGKYFYKDHLHKSNVPVLAIAGDQDIICPPEAVEETVKLFPENLVMFRVFGEQQGPHYAHYDLVGGRLAVEQVYPCIVQFLSQYD